MRNLKFFRLSAALFFILATISLPDAKASGGLQLQEQQIKAGLLYNFLKYTKWPENSLTQSTMVLCLFGNDPFDGNLKPIEGRTVNQRKITVRQIDSVSEANNCHLLFIDQNEKDAWPSLKKSLSGKNILTVSDFSSFALSGGMIEFGYNNNKISASLNVDALNNAGLHVEDRLLRLVTVVHGE